MNNKQLKTLSIIFLALLQFFFFKFVNINFNNLIFIVFFTVFSIIIIFFYFAKLVIKKKLTVFFLSSYIMLFIVELNYDKFFFNICRSNDCLNYEKKKIENSLKTKVYYNLLPKTFVLQNNDILPLSTFSKSYVLGDNENNYFPYFFTDRYGFINEDSIYDKEEIDFLIIGDSYSMGATVNFSDNLQGNLIKKEKSAISFGMGGNGPLFALASLVEFKRNIKPKNIIYIFTETNDLSFDLFLEKKNNILIKYLQKNYSQNLIFNEKEKNKLLDKQYLILEKQKSKKVNIFYNLKLSKIRYTIGIENKGEKNNDDLYNPDYRTTIDQAITSKEINSNYFLFNKIIERMKEESEKYNFYVFYVPDKLNFIESKKSNTYFAVKNIVEKNNVKFIDLGEELVTYDKVFRSSMFPKRFSHPNNKGYEVWSEIIIKYVTK